MIEKFDIHAPVGANKKKFIIGRGKGSGRGGVAGRGNNGQKSRSGGGVRLGFEGGQTPLFRRLPRRGFSNAVFKVEYIEVNLKQIEAVYANGETVNLETLVAKGLIKKSETMVKILGKGDLTKKVTIDGLKISAGAQAAVEKVGGKVAVKESK